MDAWTKDDDQIIRDWCAAAVGSRVGYTDLGKLLGKSRAAARRRAQKLGCAPSKAWSDGELLALRSWYAEREGKPLRIEELAATLKRSHAGVALMASRLGLDDYYRPKVLRGDDGLTDGERERIGHGRYGSPELHAHRSKKQKEALARNGHPRGMLGKKHSASVRRVQVRKCRQCGIEYSVVPSSPKNYCTLKCAYASEDRISQDARQRTGERSKAWWQNATKKQLKAKAAKAVATNLERYGLPYPGPKLASNPYSRTKGGKRADLGGQFFRSAWEANYARYLRFLAQQGKIAKWEYEPKTFLFDGVTKGPFSYTPDFLVTENNVSQHYIEVKGWMDAASRGKLKRMKKMFPTVDVRVVGEREYKTLAKMAKGLVKGWE